jgi:hypothetical protein
MKALLAGKHVLLEKPSADTAEETRKMFELAKEKNLVLLEAFHYRFHPAIQRVKAILDSGELGALKSISTNFLAPSGIIKKGDIRYDYTLGGGGLMDMGCKSYFFSVFARYLIVCRSGYAMSVTRYLAGEPTEVLSATHIIDPKLSSSKLIDRGTDAHLTLANGATARINCDLSVPPRFGFIPRMFDMRVVATCEKGEVEIFNFVMPTIWHWIEVRTNEDGKVKKRTEKVYKGERGEVWWST